MVKEVIVVRVERAEEEHCNEYWRKKDFAMGHVIDHPIEPGAESHDLLRCTHTVVEKQQKSREGISNRVGMAVQI